jgi:hypothetical protein
MLWLLFCSIWTLEVVLVLSLATLLDMANRRQQASV